MPDQESGHGPVVQKIAGEIVRYLDGRDQVGDTIEGITRWWIMRQRLQEAKHRVEQAVEYLCDKGVIDKRVLPDNRVLYTRLVKDKH